MNVWKWLNSSSASTSSTKKKKEVGREHEYEHKHEHEHDYQYDDGEDDEDTVDQYLMEVEPGAPIVNEECYRIHKRCYEPSSFHLNHNYNHHNNNHSFTTSSPPMTTTTTAVSPMLEHTQFPYNPNATLNNNNNNNNNSGGGCVVPGIMPPDFDVNVNDDDDDDDDDQEEEYLGGPFETLEEEIAFLRNENLKLKRSVHYHRTQGKQLKNNLVCLTMGGKKIRTESSSAMTLSQLTEKIHARLPSFLRRAEEPNNDTIYVPSEVENEIGIIDIKSVDWWDMVDFSAIDANEAMLQFHEDCGAMQLEDADNGELGGPYIVLRESDVIDAIACFVAQCVINIPECQNLTHEEMLKMIDDTFAELRGKGIYGRLKDCFSLSYNCFGWGTTAYTVYTNYALIRTVASCVLSTAWILGILI